MQVASAITQYVTPQPVRTVVSRTRVEDSRYVVRFAETNEEIEAALKLRFEVFNLELGEGLSSSFLTGRDRDEFDETCHHLIVVEKSSDRIIGTYRLRTLEMAKTIQGFYSAGEFELSALPREVLAESVELGRACIAYDHRDRQVLHLLWKALAQYTLTEGKRFLFGCCSLTSREPAEGQRLFQQLSAAGYLHNSIHVTPQPGFEVSGEPGWEFEVKVPRLFRTYLSIGAKVCGPPAIDRAFKTIDYFVIFDLFEMSERARRLLFGN